MAATAVTEVRVDASGALRALGQVEDAFESAGRASDQSAGAVAKFEAAMAKYQQTVARGDAITMQSIERRSREQVALERYESKLGETAALEIKLRREAERVAVDAANAVALGLRNEAEARNLVIATERRHLTLLAESRAKTDGLVSSQAQAVTKIDATTAAYTRMHKAANDNSISTANLAAQFQDIAVTASMGMSPLQIALQQGTQISGAFGNAGAASAVKALGSAFLSVINPISLVTIALVAGVAAAIQYFSGMGEGSKNSVQSMAKLADTLDGVRGMMKGLESVQNDYREAVLASSRTHSSASASMIADTKAEFDAKKSLLELQLQYQQALLTTKQAEIDAKQRALQNEVQKAVTTRMDLDSRGFGDSKVGRFVQLPDDITGLQKTRDLLENSPISLELKKLRADMALNEVAASELEKALATTFQSVASGTGTISQFGAAADASAQKVLGFSQALNTLAGMVPNLAAAQRVTSDLTSANDAYRAALGALNRDMQTGVIKSEEVYFQKLKQVEDMHRQAIDAVSGYSDVVTDLTKAERENAIDGMSASDAAAARIRDTYAEQEKAIRSKLGASRSDAEISALVQRNTEAMNVALANSSKHFEEQADKIGDRGAAKALREYNQELEQAQGTADRLVDKLFPGEGARREAEELMTLLDQYGDKLTEVQRKAVQTEAGNLFKAADLGLRDLDDSTKKHGKSMAEELQSTLGDALSSLFESPIKDLDDFVNRVLSAFAKLGEQNLQNAFDGLFSNGQTKGSRQPSVSQGGGLLDQAVGWVKDLFTGKSFASEQSKQVVTASAKLSAKPLVGTVDTLADSLSKATTSIGGSMSQYAASIRKIESGSYDGDYGAIGPATRNGDHAYGAYQVMGNNIGAWTKELTGYSVSTKDFLNNRQLQDNVFYQQFGKSLDKWGNVSDAVAVHFSGRPVTQAGNASDGYNTTPQYLSKFNAALSNIPGQVQTGAAKGIVAGTQQVTGSLVQAAGGGSSGGAGLGSAAAGQNSGFGGALSAGLGGFGLGAQSGSPIMGALGGAISGFSAGGIPGAIIGGLAGIFGGIFGGNQKKKQEKNAAKATLNENRGAIADYLTVANGGQPGSYMSEWNQIRDQGIQFEQQANKAGEKKTTGKSIIDSINGAFIRLWKEQTAGLDGTLAAYSSGLGQDSGFLQGQSAVKGLGDVLKGLVQDIGDMRHKAIELKAIAPEQVDSYNRETDAKIAQTQGAAQKMALATITGAQQFSAMETQMQKFDGAAVALQGTLEQLGMTTDEAAAAIKGALDLGIAKLRDSYSSDLNASINDKSGLGFLNDLQSAQQAYQSRLKDATALGMDGSLALRELALSVQQIGKDAGFSKDEITLLSGAFPQLQFMLSGLTDQTKSYADAQSDLQSAYDDASGKLEDTISGLKTFSKSLQDFLDKMKIDDSSPLSTPDKLAEAAKQFRDTATKAASGDTDAMGNLTSKSQDYLDLAQGYYTSSTAYQQIWQEVQDTLSGTKVTADKTLTDTQRQLDVMKDQVGKLIDIDDSVMSVAEAVNAFNAAQTRSIDDLKTQLGAMAQVGSGSISAAYQSSLDRAPTSGEALNWQNQLNTGSTIDQVTGAISNSFEAQINALSKQYLGHTTDAGAVDYWKSTGITNMSWIGQAMNDSFEGRLNALYKDIFGRVTDQQSLGYWQNSGKSLDQIEADLHWQKSLGAFANGGDHKGGLRIVGERGPELEATGPSRIWTADQTKSFMRGSGDESAVVVELRETRAELAKVQAQLAAMAKGMAALAGGMQQQISLTAEGNEIQAENASTLRKVAAR